MQGKTHIAVGATISVVMLRPQTMPMFVAGMAALYCCTTQILDDSAPYFLTAYASHLVLDMPNYNGSRLFCPFRKKFALKLAKSDGKADKIIFALFFAVLIPVSMCTKPVNDILMRGWQVLTG